MCSFINGTDICFCISVKMFADFCQTLSGIPYFLLKLITILNMFCDLYFGDFQFANEMLMFFARFFTDIKYFIFVVFYYFYYFIDDKIQLRLAYSFHHSFPTNL